MLKYTGNPYIDVGVATILAFSGKRKTNQITENDLEKIADYLEENYPKSPLSGFFMNVFMNAAFTQSSLLANTEKQKLYADRVFRSFRSSIPTMSETDVFLELPIPRISFDIKDGLEPGRTFREHIPLLSGRDVINFYPLGESGLPISGLALLVIQVLPLGCARCSGGLLAIQSDNPSIMEYFARTNLERNKKEIALAQQANTKLSPSLRTLKTLLLEHLINAMTEQIYERQEGNPFSITGYHINNGKSPYVNIHYLPNNLILFLQIMNRAEYSHTWKAIVHQAWEVPKARKEERETKTKPEMDEFHPRKNYIYEDLFQLPENAKRFIRTYFLRKALKLVRMEPGDPRRGYSTQFEIQLISWKITEEFLRRILNMDEEHITQIRYMGDRLAEYVFQENDKRFFQAFYRESKYEYFRNRLIKTNLAHVNRGNAPILQFEPYIQVFEEGLELARPDWRLARDLILIRMVEQLHTRGWFSSNPDAITNEVLESSDEESE